MNTRLSFSEAKQVPITEYLSGIGLDPAKIRGEDYWYHSPFREERTPSFKVNTKLNVWYDHGTGEGGTILDLGAKLNQCTLVEFAQKLLEGDHTFSFHRQFGATHKPDNTLEVLGVHELQSEDLLHYLNARGISNVTAIRFCKEVDFKIRDRAYKAIGFPNKSGAWELRTNWFKGSSAPKDISIIASGNTRLAVLEGFIDFLSLQQTDQRELQDLRNNSDFLILNSLRLLKGTVPLLQSYREVNLLLDNDQPAKEAKVSLKEKGIPFNDASSLYVQHKDVNEFHIDNYKDKLNQGLSKRKSRKIRR